MKNIWKKHLFRRCLALFLSAVLLFTGVNSARAIDLLYSNNNHHYLIYNNMDSLVEMMTKAYEENNLALLGVNVFLPKVEESLIEDGEDLLLDIENNLYGKYLVETIEINEDVIVYFTVDVFTLEIYLLVSNATEEEHSFTIVFADGMEFDEIATAYSFDARLIKIMNPINPVTGGAIEPVTGGAIGPVTGGAIIIDVEDDIYPIPIKNEDEEFEESPIDPKDGEYEIVPVKPIDLLPLSAMNQRIITYNQATVDINSEDGTVITEPGDEVANPEPGDGDEVANPEPGDGDEVVKPEPGSGDEVVKPEPGNGAGSGIIMPLYALNITAEAALATMKSMSISFTVLPSSTNAIEGYITDSILVTPTIDKTGSKNEDGSYTINLSVTGDQDERIEIITETAPINIVFAVDVSDSMDYALSHDSAPGWGEKSRWKILTEQMSNMVDYVLSSTTGNQSSLISIIAYSNVTHNNTQTGDTFSRLLVDRGNDPEAIKNSYSKVNNNNIREPLSLETVRGSNEFGTGTNNHAGLLGVRFHLSNLTSNNNPTYVIYLTDGELTRYMIKSGNNYRQSNRVDTDASAYPNAFNQTIAEARLIKSTYPEVTIYTIGLGTQTDKMKSLLNPQSNPYQKNYYFIQNIAQFNQIFTDLSKEFTKSEMIYVTNMKITDKLSQYVTWEPNSFVIKYNGSTIYDMTNPSEPINTNNWPDENLPQYDSLAKTINWTILDEEGKLGSNQKYELQYRVRVNNANLSTVPENHKLSSYYHDWDNDGVIEIRYYNREDAAYWGLTDDDRVPGDREVYYPSNEYAILDYNDGNSMTYLHFPHPAVKSDVTGTLTIGKFLSEISDKNLKKNFIFEVKIGENGNEPSLYNGTVTINNGTTLETKVLTNGVLVLKENEIATIKLETLKSSYVVTELYYVDETGYSESVINQVQREERNALTNALVSNGEVSYQNTEYGYQVEGNLFSTNTVVEEGEDSYWETRDVDNGTPTEWKRFVPSVIEKDRIVKLPKDSDGSHYETGKLSNGALIKLPTPSENVNGHYVGSNWRPWANSVSLSFNSSQYRVRNGAKQYNLNGWKTAATIYNSNTYRSYNGYVELGPNSGGNNSNMYVIRFYKLEDTNAYNDIREYRLIPGKEGEVIETTIALDVDLRIMNDFRIINGTIEVEKVIDKFLPQHGDAIFYFRLDRLDGMDEDSQILRTYYDFLEFDMEVDLGAGSIANDSKVLFDKLPKGYYRLTELQPIRYEYESVEAWGANAVYENANSSNNGMVMFEITSSDQEGKAVYNNKKTYDKYFSHTDVKRNSITVKKNSSIITN